MELVLRLVVAAVLGGLVGLERERLEWAAVAGFMPRAESV